MTGPRVKSWLRRSITLQAIITMVFALLILPALAVDAVLVEHNVTTEPAVEYRPDLSRLSPEQRQTLKEILLVAKGEGTIEE
jgi:hypothetical protein